MCSVCQDGHPAGDRRQPIVFASGLLLIVACVQTPADELNTAPAGTGRTGADYLSQVPPGTTPVRFAPDNIKPDGSDYPVPRGPYFGQSPPGMTPEVFATGIVSGDTYFEHSSPSFSPDGRAVYWSVLTVHNGRRDEKIMFTELRDSGWTKPQVAPFNKEHHGGGLAFSPDGKLLYFYSARPFHRDEDGFTENIWALELDGGKHSEPFKLDSVISSHEHSERSPSFSSNGTMYFDRGRAGTIDIYRAKHINGQYQEPEKLGAEVNTSASEYAPCIAPDESFLVFSRFVDDESGKSVKLYVSFKRADGSWTKARCLGDKLPLCNRARFPGLSPDGKYLFFCAHKDGRPDVYWVDARVLDELKPDELK
ncbi:MAG: PD40 domain-containing protein [Candidatus Zixiibacteriota bacterium]|nr:MAG: PD40 domain-containing protein [candidate division Zixibacteria bacterium]